MSIEKHWGKYPCPIEIPVTSVSCKRCEILEGTRFFIEVSGDQYRLGLRFIWDNPKKRLWEIPGRSDAWWVRIPKSAIYFRDGLLTKFNPRHPSIANMLREKSVVDVRWRPGFRRARLKQQYSVDLRLEGMTIWHWESVTGSGYLQKKP